MPDTGGCGSVFLWRRCNTACTSGFVYDVMFAMFTDVMFARNLPGRGDASREFIQSGSPIAAPDPDQSLGPDLQNILRLSLETVTL